MKFSAWTPAASGPEAEAAAQRSRRLLSSVSAGTAALVLGAALALVADGRGFPVALALVSGGALVLRARTYRFVPEALPPALAGGVGLVVLEAALGVGALAPRGLGGWAVCLLVLTALGLGGLSLLAPRLPPPGRGVRLAWLAVDVALGPLALGTLGVFSLLGELAQRVFH